MTEPDGADLCGIAVNWHLEPHVEELIRAWPKDARFELIVVDNSSSLSTASEDVRVLRPSRNLGFAGAINLGCRRTTAPLVITLNPDACPEASALEELVAGFEKWPDASGLAPRLVGPDGRPQTAWQLRSLPSPWTLMLQAFFIPAGPGSDAEPAPGATIEQPAAAALAMRRQTLVEIGGFDENFHPAWFEDVDLAARLNLQGAKIRYCPSAVFTHQLGASVSKLGYERFVWSYYKNLCRYLEKHHGRGWSLAARTVLCFSAPARLLLVPLRKPSRAASRSVAARGLIGLVHGAMTNWEPLATDSND
jgi:GT2 family glycosyltransferase